MGQHGDYRDVKADTVTVRDLLDFDALMTRLTDDERTTVNRKIAHAISESDEAAEFESRGDTISELESINSALEEQRAKLTDRISELEREIESLGNAIKALKAEREKDRETWYAEGHADGKADGYARGREDAA